MSRGAPVFQLYRVDGADGVWWRVVSPNGRALARVPAALTDLDEAMLQVEEIRLRREALVPGLRVTPAHRWRWELSLDEEVVVLGSAAQDRRVRADAAWQAFVALAGVAVVDPHVHVFRRGYAVPAQVR